MKTIGLFDAKTRLSEICREVVESGEEFVITRRGQEVARIVPPLPKKGPNPYLDLGVVEALAAWEKRHGVPPEDEVDFPDVWLSRHGSKPDPLAES
ncbi:MAG: type II toxin-antitoxin system Phd/YefM family antitoxin [Verrucomicrobiota bacterium]